MTSEAPNAKRQEFFLLLAIVFMGALLRWVFLSGPLGSDDTRYIRAASLLATGAPPDGLDHAYVRAIFIAWLGFWIRMGAELPGLAIAQLGLSIAILPVFYRLGTRLAHPQVALLATLWWAFFTFEFHSSGMILPDSLMLFFALLAACWAIDALRSPAGQGKRKLVAAALASALATSAKEPAILLPVIFGAWSLWEIRPRRRALGRSFALAVLTAGFFSLEFLFFAWWAGDWNFREHAALAFYSAQGPLGDRAFTWRDALYYPAMLLYRIEYVGFFGWLLLLGTWRYLRAMREVSFICIWSAGFFLLLQYGSASLESYQPLPKQWRYAVPMIVLLFFPLGAMTLELLRTPGRWRATAVLGLAALLASGVFIANRHAARPLGWGESMRFLETAVRFTSGAEVGPIYLPEGLKYRTPLELADATREWREIVLWDGLSESELREIEASNGALAIPDQWFHSGDRAPAMRPHIEAQLARHFTPTPIASWNSPLDRAIEGLGAHALARRRVIGQIYRIQPSPPLDGLREPRP